MSERVLVDPHRCGCGRQVAGPNNRDAHATRQPQASVFDREAAHRVLKAGQGCLVFLERGAAPAPHLERVLEGERVVAECLLLCNLGALVQPTEFGTRCGEQLGQPHERGTVPDPLLVHRLVPQEPAAVPLGHQRTLRFHTGTKPVGVANRFDGRHVSNYTVPWYLWILRMSGRTTMSSTAVHTTSFGAPSTDRNVLVDPDVAARLKQIIREVCAERDAPIVELETMPDHVHLLVTCDPQFGIHRLVKQIKGRSSRLLRQEFPSIKSRAPHALDQLVLRRHGRRCDPGGRQALCREPTQRLSTLTSPCLKPGVSRVFFDDDRHPEARSRTP